MYMIMDLSLVGRSVFFKQPLFEFLNVLIIF